MRSSLTLAIELTAHRTRIQPWRPD